MRQITLDPNGDRLVLSFPYHPDLVELVRGLPGRRFDRESKTWSVPSAHATEVAAQLRDHGFAISDEAATLVDETALEAAASREPDAAPVAESHTTTVSELNERVRSVIQRALPRTIWVAGEIAGFERNRHKRHCYFELIEKADDDERPRARVSAVLFEGARARIEERLARCADPFELADGIEVRVAVRCDVYPVSGSYQVLIEDIDPVHTLGKLAAARDAILRELDRRGLRERNRALALPTLPLRVGLITSWGSDAFNDVRQELAQSGLAFRLDVHDARMQGADLRRTVQAALAHFAERAADYDVVVIARGGGAKGDLAWFDDLGLAVAVATHPVKIVCGIGHERDQGVLDAIATSVKTPTAAAQLLVGRVSSANDDVIERAAAIVRGADRAVERARERLGDRTVRVARAASAGVVAARVAVDHRVERVAQSARRPLDVARPELRRRATALASAARVATREADARLATRTAALAPSRLAALVDRVRERVDARAARLALLDPRRVVQRGFAIVRDADGRVVTDCAATKAGASIRVTLRDGDLTASVDDVRSSDDEQ